MKKIYLSIVLLALVSPIIAQLSRTIDHTTADIHSIPNNWIDSAKAKLDIVFWRASHGTQLTNGGMNALRNYSTENAALYNFSENGGEGVLKLVEFQMDLEHENDTWVATTEAYLADHTDVNTVMWAWCDIRGMDIDQYLDDMEMLIAKYGPGGTEGRENPVSFVFMNAHTYPYADYGEQVYNSNMQIREYCEDHNRWFYDFYDLECFDPDENYFGDGTADRGPWNGINRLRWDMSYDLEEGGRGNWGIEWMNANPGTELTALSADNICQSCEHSDGDGEDDNSRLHCVLKGQAAWWLWARLAGWQEEAVIPVTEIVVTGAGGVSIIDVNNGTLQMEAEVLPVDATYKSVAWSVDNGTGEATISSGGLLTAVADGTVTVIATSADGLVTGELVVTISNQNPAVPVTEIIVTGAGGATTIEVENGTLQMEAEVLPANATDKSVTWSVNNGTGEATISSGGLLTAVDDGTVTVNATSADGLVSGELVITISNQNPMVPVTDIIVTGAGGASTIEVDNGTLQMEAEVLPANATNKSVSWSLDNGTGEATINSGGLLTALRNGTVSAVATSADGLVKGELVVTISNQSTTGISDQENSPDILVHGRQLMITLKQSDPVWGKSTLKVFTIAGTEILTSSLNQGINEIEINKGPGIYVLLLQFPEKTTYHKVYIH